MVFNFIRMWLLEHLWSVCCRIYLCKQWQELKVFNDHTALATGVSFGQNAGFVASVSMDRSLKIFSLWGGGGGGVCLTNMWLGSSYYRNDFVTVCSSWLSCCQGHVTLEFKDKTNLCALMDCVLVTVIYSKLIIGYKNGDCYSIVKWKMIGCYN